MKWQITEIFCSRDMVCHVLKAYPKEKKNVKVHCCVEHSLCSEKNKSKDSIGKRQWHIGWCAAV
jgi:hypothetical protein